MIIGKKEFVASRTFAHGEPLHERRKKIVGNNIDKKKTFLSCVLELKSIGKSTHDERIFEWSPKTAP